MASAPTPATLSPHAVFVVDIDETELTGFVQK
jgi:hypothetical protein